jgi:hypothetical protein
MNQLLVRNVRLAENQVDILMADGQFVRIGAGRPGGPGAGRRANGGRGGRGKAGPATGGVGRPGGRAQWRAGMNQAVLALVQSQAAQDFGCGVLLNPCRLCEPSQKGLFSEWPHRHNQTCSPSKAKVAPAGVTILTGPFMRYGPLSCTVTVTTVSSSMMHTLPGDSHAGTPVATLCAPVSSNLLQFVAGVK